MKPLNPLPCPPNGPGEPLPCTEVWSQLQPYQRDTLQRVLLRVCCQLARLSQAAADTEARRFPAPSGPEVAHERA
jgi:hypothetical protein